MKKKNRILFTHKCMKCGTGIKESIKIPGYKLFFDGSQPKEIVTYHNSCMHCCEPIEPKFEDIEDALTLMITAGNGLSPQQRKWFMFNTPLPYCDSDEKAIELAETLTDM